ncbi:hypothetical protein N7495_007421 [Penicillium taxi]|uniref:uncharacterized protein n=1 Tax=Penicillium taxi TaxID=168475 RepID=UPI0025456758|nr:uncharacterized protein N7495_007421 [Penicillium taxi]KAJ5887380.1 hypothetical protein N7495_007421 [Penicillium taxi]
MTLLSSDFRQKGTLNWQEQKDDAWTNFDQGSILRGGEPKLRYKYYKKLLRHPNFRPGTTILSEGGERVLKTRASIRTSSLQRHKEHYQGAQGHSKYGISLYLLSKRIARNPLKAPPSKHDYRKKVLLIVIQQSLLFKFIESPLFKDLIEFCKSYPNLIKDLSRSTIKQLSQSEAEEVQKQLIKRLLSTTKEYQEVLLGFEPLYRAYSRQYLASIVLKVLKQHKLK